MRLHDYQKNCLRTAPEKQGYSLSTFQYGLLHAILGIAGEVGEILGAEGDKIKIKEEIGDSLWYISLGFDEMGLDLEDIESDTSTVDPYYDLQTLSSDLVDAIKRNIYYHTELDQEAVAETFGKVMGCLEEVANEYGMTLEECMESNIAKLKVRYPNKFSTEQAVNRNLTKEQKALEQ